MAALLKKRALAEFSYVIQVLLLIVSCLVVLIQIKLFLVLYIMMI